MDDRRFPGPTPGLDLAGLKRRDLLRRGGSAAITLGAAPWILAACGGEDDATAPRTSTEPAAAPSGTVDFFGYEGEDFPDLIKDWKAQTGVKVKASYMAGEADIEAKVLGGSGAGLDVIGWGHPFKERFEAADIFSPLDPAKIPNLDDLLPYFTSDIDQFTKNASGEWVAVPFYWGSIGVVYDTGVIPESSSWNDLLDPKFKGKLGIADNPIANLFVSCAVLGFDPAALTTEQEKQVADHLRQFVAQAKAVSPSYGDLITLLASGEITGVFGGFPFLVAAAGKKTLKVNIEPDEGTAAFIEMYSLASTADNADAGHAFINEMLDPAVQAQIASVKGAGVVVQGALDQLDKGAKTLYPYDDISGYFDRLKLFSQPAQESDEYVTLKQWLKTWNEIKAGA